MLKSLPTKLASTLLIFSSLVLSGCNVATPSDSSYWFSKTSTEFIAYNEEKDNLDEAGNYWHFTSKKEADIDMYLRIDVDNIFSTAYLYLDDVQVKSEVDTGVFTFAYKLSLKKNSEIKIHAFWNNSLKTTAEGFTMSMIAIGYEGQQYVLKEFDNTKK